MMSGLCSTVMSALKKGIHILVKWKMSKQFSCLTFDNGDSAQVNQNNTSDNLTGSSTVLKLEWTEVRLGGSAHQPISKDNDNQAAGSQFQELGCVLC